MRFGPVWGYHSAVKPTFQFGFLLVVLAALPLCAQINGVPPSVTSFTGKVATGPAPSVTSFNGTNFAPGVRPSVSSLGPRGYTPGFTCTNSALVPSALGCTNPAFTPTIDFTTGRVLFGQTINTRVPHNHRRGGYPVYVPYAYPYPVVVDAPTEEEVQPEDPPGPTIYDRYGNRPASPMPGSYPAPQNYPDPRLRAASPPASSAIASEEPAAAATESEPPRNETPTVLIFKDGHQQQVTNYAIVGDTLFDLGTFVAHRIKLADLDLNETAKVNEDRGVDFTLPASYKN